MNWLSWRARLGMLASGAAVAVVLIPPSGANAATPQPGAAPPVASPVAPSSAAGTDPADGSHRTRERAATHDEATILFTGSTLAPLMCDSTPNTTAITITDATRITLANLTGADAGLDTGSEQALTVADGIGVSVRFRPGQYAIRMVPNCALTGDVGLALLTVTAASSDGPGATLPPQPQPGPPQPGPAPTAAGDPRPSLSVPSTSPDRPNLVLGPAPTTSLAAASPMPQNSATETAPEPPAVAAQQTDPAVTPPSMAVAHPGGLEPAFYDIELIALQHPGDPRDTRLLLVVAVICVFGVGMAIIRAILSQRARHTVST